MTSRRVLKSILCNFLGTYTSRYTEYGGFWLFGFIVEKLNHEEFDLLQESDTRTMEASLARAAQLACQKFNEQVRKAGLDRSRIQSARLSISRMNDLTDVRILRGWRGGRALNFSAHAVTDLGRKFTCEQFLMIAPHDPKLEYKSGPHYDP